MELTTIDNLVKETGCDKAFAKLLLIFTGGDKEAAKKIINSIEKDIVAIKGVSSCGLLNKYIDFVVFYNIKKQCIEKAIVVTSNNSVITNINVEDSFIDFIGNIKKFKSDFEEDSSINDSLIDYFYSSFALNIFKSIFSLKFIETNKFNHSDLIKDLSSIVENVTADSNIVLKADVELIDIFMMNKHLDGNNDFESFEVNVKPDEDDLNNNEDELELVMLECEPSYSPISGITVNDLNKGDTVRVKIVDDRKIGLSIRQLMNGEDEDGEIKPVESKVLNIEKLDEDLVMLILDFGPGIHGKLVCGNDVKIEGEFAYSIDYNNKKKKGKKVKKGFNIATNLIVMFIILIIIIIVLLLLIS